MPRCSHILEFTVQFYFHNANIVIEQSFGTLTCFGASNICNWLLPVIIFNLILAIQYLELSNYCKFQIKKAILIVLLFSCYSAWWIQSVYCCTNCSLMTLPRDSVPSKASAAAQLITAKRCSSCGVTGQQVRTNCKLIS